MPLIDFQCYFGARGDALSVRTSPLELAALYATDVAADLLLFSSEEANTDVRGGSSRLAEALKTDSRYRGWLSLSVHQPDLSQELAKRHLGRAAWVGSRLDQHSDGDAVNAAGGSTVLNALRRYSRPVLITVNSPATLQAAIWAAREFHTLKFIIAPQNEDITADSVPAIREVINTWWLPSAAYAERDIVAQAVASLGDKRVLWCSEWGRLHPAAALGMINESRITEAQRERVVFRNAKELLSLDD